jgi:phosphoribosylanthranilate isomerase
MGNLKIKVCGMREPKNIAGIAKVRPDFIGFIFYPKSKRFTGYEAQPTIIEAVSSHIRKVGVFVNEATEQVFVTAQNWKLNVIQLHGQETPDYCRTIQNSGYVVFKAFPVDELFDFESLKAYQNCCDYFLFDTKGKLPGGTGQKFNWQLLDNYTLNVPFFLSGGIGPDDVKNIRNFRHPQLFGLDINSGFEISPGTKDVEKVRKFILEIRSK